MKTMMIALAAACGLALLPTDVQAFGRRAARSNCSCGTGCACTPANNCGCDQTQQTQLVRVGLFRWQRVPVTPTGNYVTPTQQVQTAPSGVFAPVQLAGGCPGGKCFR